MILQLGVLLLAVSSSAAYATSPDLGKMGSLQFAIATHPLAPHAVEVEGPQNFSEWGENNGRSLLEITKTITSIWKDNKIASQCMMLGVQTPQKSFTVQLVPYQDANALTRIPQQMKVLWKLTVGAPSLNDQEIAAEKQLFSDWANFSSIQTTHAPIVGTDPFCNQTVIDKQLVAEGKTLSVLYSYAPVVDRHFLFVPKIHRETLEELSSEELGEIIKESARVVSVLTPQGQPQRVFWMMKFGEDAGQTVKHLHAHLMLPSDSDEEGLGKATVLKNILLGSSPLNNHELQAKVAYYKENLKL